MTTPTTDLITTTSDDLATRMRYAQALAHAQLLPRAYRDSPADVLLAVELAHALGISPVVAINSVSVLDGVPAMSAELMRALVLRAGHRFRILESTPTGCTVEVARHDDPDSWSRFTFATADATRAGLLPARPRSGWERYPAAMFLARATSAACRAVFPDVLAGVSYVPEELGGDDTAAPARWPAPGPADPVDAVVVEDLEDAEVVDPDDTIQPRAAAMDRTREAMDLPARGDDRPPTDPQLRALNARLREHGCRDVIHRGWVVAALLDRPAWVESLRTLTRTEVSALLDRLEVPGEAETIAGVMAATANLGHPDDLEGAGDPPDDRQNENEDDEDTPLDLGAETFEDVTDPDGPPARPKLTTDGGA